MPEPPKEIRMVHGENAARRALVLWLWRKQLVSCTQINNKKGDNKWMKNNS
jgi:hypothetical protein